MRKRKSIELGGRLIFSDSKPYVIAEIGVNHEGSLEQAKALIKLAKEGGADAAKFQSYKADTLASKDSPAYWDVSKEQTKSQHELFKKYDSFEQKDYVDLYNYCKEVDIVFLSTPFDDEAIEFLDPIVPFFKIASADITNTPFLKKIAKKGKPVLLSTGASTLSEIQSAVTVLEESNCDEIALLHCILNYPTPYPQAHLRMIKNLIDVFPSYIIGYSDHTLPDDAMSSLIAAHLLGAVIIEKHFTHNKLLPGNDHYHAMDTNDLKKFITLSNKIHISLGQYSMKRPIETEEISRLNARRSIVLKKEIYKNEVLTEDHITYKRPGRGISPIHWDDVIGKKVIKNLAADEILLWEYLK